MTAVLLPNGKQQFFTTPGVPAVGYKLATFAAGTSTPQTTWSDALQIGANTNPIILDARGEAVIFWSGTYKVQLQDSTGVPIWTVDNVQSAPPPSASLIPTVDNSFTLGSVSFSWANVYVGANHAAILDTVSGNVGYYARTAAEIAAVVTPTNYVYPPGDVRRYGADITGVADSTVAINNALLSNGLVYAITGTYKCSNALNMISGQTFYGDGSATVLSYALGSVDNIYMNGLTSSTVRDLKIVCTGAPGGSKTAAVHLFQTTNCEVLRVEASGYPFAGVWLDQSNYNTVRDCYLHDANTAVGTGNGGDIIIYGNSTTLGSNYNIFDGNKCYGNNNGYGIMVMDPDLATVVAGYPHYNIATNNRVGRHLYYGMAMYLPGNGAGAADTHNQFIGNYIENVTGLRNGGADGAGGAGIYVVGFGAGGSMVANNIIYNCCTATTVRTLAPAGIGVNGIQAGVTRPIVANNIISGMTQGDGILVTSSPGGAVVSGNSINLPSTNNGSGPGGAPLQGAALRCEASSDVTWSGNNAICFGTNTGVYIYANGVNNNRITVDGCDVVTSGAGAAMQASQNGGFNINYLSVSDSVLISNNATVDCITLNAVVVGTFSNVRANATTQRALFVNGCTQMRITGGEYQTTGTVAIGTSGTCTSSFIDKSVWFGGVSSLINNAGTGCNIEWRVTSNAVPTTGTFALGDSAIPVNLTIGNPKGWITTAAGTPGTQTSIGNL